MQNAQGIANSVGPLISSRSYQSIPNRFNSVTATARNGNASQHGYEITLRSQSHILRLGSVVQHQKTVNTSDVTDTKRSQSWNARSMHARQITLSFPPIRYLLRFTPPRSVPTPTRREAVAETSCLSSPLRLLFGSCSQTSSHPSSTQSSNAAERTYGDEPQASWVHGTTLQHARYGPLHA